MAAKLTPRFWFAPNGFENTPHPCICVDDPQGGDPKILAIVKVLYRPTDLHGLCGMANHYLALSETDARRNALSQHQGGTDG